MLKRKRQCMLIKTMSRKSNGGQLLAYVCRYILDPAKNELIVPGPHHSKETVQVIIRHNIRARASVRNFIKEFEENEKFRLVHRRDTVKLFHTVIAFGTGDKQKITPAMLKDIAHRFVELRGTNNLYLGTAHYNTDSTHLHIVVSGMQLNG
jgi:hypothetical protein